MPDSPVPPELDPGVPPGPEIYPQHLVIVINNSIQPNAQQKEKENYNCDNLIQLFGTRNFKGEVLTNIEANNERLSNILNSVGPFASRWLVFIGSAIECGPVAEDNRVFNVRRILKKWKTAAEPKFLVIFGSPHDEPETDQHEAIDIEGPHTFEQLLSIEYYSKREKMRLLCNNIQDELLNNLDENLNYFFTSVPISIKNNDNKTLVDLFVENIHLSATQQRLIRILIQH
jgi:hypothetical protein